VVGVQLWPEVTMTAPASAAMRRAVIVAAITGMALAIGVVLSNVVFANPSNDDDGFWPIVAYAAVFAAFLLTGHLAARVDAGPRIQAFAGAVAGALIGILTTGAFFAVDNIFLSVVAKQPSKIDGLAHSGMTSMREYLNASLVGPLVFWTVGFAVFGAILAIIGGAFARPVRRPQSPFA
jgi:hypothetical protein